MSDSASTDPKDQQLWHALLRTHLRLAEHTQFTEQVHRGQIWVVIHDPVRNQFYKTSPEIYRLLRCLDGQQTLQEVLDQNLDLSTTFADHSQSLPIIAQLLDAGLLHSDSGYDFASEITKQREKEKNLGRLRWQRPWMVKLPLFNPDRLLSQLYEKTCWLWTRAMLVVWMVTVASAALVLTDYWPYLVDFWRTRFLDPVNLLLLVAIFPLLKACHELAHGLVTKKWGGRVYEVGLMFLVFMPVPYVDATASTQFANKYQRMLVAASGVMTELFFAALALLLWINSDSVLIKDICLNIMIIGAVSSVLFNGNPLLRFDGYYVLSDALEIPNLASRAQLYVRGIWQRVLLGLVERPVHTVPGEKKWLLFYGVFSGIYRVILSFSIAVYIAGHYFFVGILLAIWALILQILWPLIKSLRNSLALAQQYRRRKRAVLIYGVIASAIFVVLFVVPVQHSSHAPALMTVAGEYQIKTGAEGFLQTIHVANGARISAGQTLLTLHNPTLESEIAGFEAQVAEAEVYLNRALSHEPDQAGFYRDELTRLRQALADRQDDRQNLTVTSNAAGVVEIPDLENLLGRYYAQGDTLGHIVAADAHKLIALLPEQAGDRTAQGIKEIWVKLHAYPQQVFAASLLREIPSASRQLPDAYLGSLFGGPVAVDTSSAEGTRALQPWFQLELALKSPPPLPTTGRAHVLLVHHKQPVGLRLWRWLRLEFLQRFNV